MRPAWSIVTLILAGCATSADPAKGGFISGAAGLLSGSYDQRVAGQSNELARMRAQQAAAEAEARGADAALQQRQQSVASMRASVAKLDRSLQAARAKVDRQRAGNAALSATDVQLTRELETAQARLARLRTQLGSTRSSEDYEAVRREYESLEAAIQALNQQIEGGQR
jgi:chromosome segregation ATPase